MPPSTDLGGCLVFPGLIDTHTHLDKAHTWDRAPNPTGEFWDAITALHADSARWTAKDIRRRAHFALQRAWAHGTTAIRTHVDTGDAVGEAGLAVMQELRSEWKERITLQSVSLCNVAGFAGGGARRVLELTERYGATALGGFPQPNPDLSQQFDYLLAAAKDAGLGVDLHVDESGLIEAECLRLLAEAVLRNQFPYPVTCGHCCSLAVHAPARRKSTIERVREAGIRVISLPLCNLYLQDRRREAGVPATPHWRGITLLHELMEAGVPVACASDNVRDAFYAYGDLDAVEVMVQSIRIGHLDTRMPAAATVVTSTAADILGLPDHGRIDAGARAELVVFEARRFSELLAFGNPPRRLISGEAFRSAAPPPYSALELEASGIE